VQALDAGQAVPPVALRHLNRLGDLLFVLARLANHAAGTEERPWKP
jgi:cob(I)alamin adenosyltransferase